MVKVISFLTKKGKVRKKVTFYTSSGRCITFIARVKRKPSKEWGRKMLSDFSFKLLEIVSIAILLIFIFKLYFNWVKEITGFHLKFFLIACILSILVSLIIINR